MPAKNDYPTEDRDLGDGRRVLWSKLRRTPGVGWEVLTSCGKHPDRWVLAYDAIKPGFTGRCKQCHNEELPQKYAGARVLPKGTTARFDLRDGRRIGIECRGCFDPKLQNFKYVDLSNLTRYTNGRVKWDELCSECIAARGSLKRHVEDKQSLVSETWTRFSEEKGGRVPVDAALCGCRWWTTRVNAVNNWDIYIDICPTHQHRPRELAALLLSRTSAVVPQKSREDKVRERREATVADLLKRISAEVKKRKRAGEAIEDVTADEVARELSIGGNTGGNVMMERLRRNGYPTTWATLRREIWDNGEPRRLHENRSQSRGVTPRQPGPKIVEAR